MAYLAFSVAIIAAGFGVHGFYNLYRNGDVAWLLLFGALWGANIAGAMWAMSKMGTP